MDIRGRRILLVDDIVDTGETLRVAKAYLESKGPREVRAAAPYVKPKASLLPEYYVKVVDRWVVFPYEYRETIKELGSQIDEIQVLDSNVAKAVIEMENT